MSTLIAAALSLVIAQAPQAPPPPLTSVVRSVMVVDISGEPASAARQATALVANATRRQPNLRLTLDTDLKKVLGEKAAGQLDECQQDPGCVARLAEPLNVNFLVTGSIAATSRNLVLNLALIDRPRAFAINRAGATFRADQNMKAQVDAMVDRLFGSKPAQIGISLGDTEKVTSFAVLDFEVSGISEGLGLTLTQSLSQELKLIDGISVINRDDIVRLIGLEKMRRVLDEDCDDTCFIKIGDSLNTDYVVIGQVAKMGGTFFVNLTLLDKKAGSLADGVQVSESYRGSDDELVRAVRHLGRRMLGRVSKDRGTIAVLGSQVSDATVLVDQNVVGRLPLPPDQRRLPTGRHSVLVQKDGFKDWHADFYILPNETTEIWAEVAEEPERWYQKWWVWTIVGAAVAGGTAAAVVSTQSKPDTGGGSVIIE